MKLSEYTGEKAIEVLGDLIEPCADILANEDIRKLISSKKPKLVIASAICKKTPKAVLKLMAAIEQKPVKDFEKEVNIFTLPMKLLDILNDENVMNLFQSQGQGSEQTSSAPASTITKAKKK